LAVSVRRFAGLYRLAPMWRVVIVVVNELPEEDEQELAMNYERIYESWEKKTLARGRREGRAEGKAEGRREGKANAVLAVLASRGLIVTAARRKQVLACTDDAQLDAWVRAAATAPSVSALLSGGAGHDGGHPQTPARRLRAK
jgi:hypothetical protein